MGFRGLLEQREPTVGGLVGSREQGQGQRRKRAGDNEVQPSLSLDEVLLTFLGEREL